MEHCAKVKAGCALSCLGAAATGAEGYPCVLAMQIADRPGLAILFVLKKMHSITLCPCLLCLGQL